MQADRGRRRHTAFLDNAIEATNEAPIKERPFYRRKNRERD